MLIDFYLGKDELVIVTGYELLWLVLVSSQATVLLLICTRGHPVGVCVCVREWVCVASIIISLEKSERGEKHGMSGFYHDAFRPHTVA